MAKTRKRKRTVVLDHMEAGGYPLIPSDERIETTPEGVDPEGNPQVSAEFPKIEARLVMTLGSDNGPVVSAAPLYDTYFALLSLASISDYKEPVVHYTVHGLLRAMEWSKGGRQARLLRRCIEHLKGVTLHFKGPSTDRLNRRVRGSGGLRIITGWFEPDREDRRDGRNLSWVEFHDRYLEAVAMNPGVQIDVEMMRQIRGSHSKALYRMLSWLRAQEEEEIDLEEAFHRVGSVRKRMAPSDAWRVFGSCFDVMVRFRHLNDYPTIERTPEGRHRMIFDWGEPIHLPHKGDPLIFQRLVDLGVDPKVAEWMIGEDKRRAAHVIQAYMNDALPKPKGSVARLLVGAFKQRDWPLPEVKEQGQLELLGGQGR